MAPSPTNSADAVLPGAGSRAEPRRRRRRRLLVVLGLALVAGALVGLDHWLPYMLLSHYKFSVDPDPEVFTDYGATHEAVAFRTSDGLTIAGWFVPAKGPCRGGSTTLVVLHTLGRTREDMLSLALPLWRKGFALLLIDLRGHGESDGDHFTYGYHEWRDVAAAIDYLVGRQDGCGDRVAVLGASAGGAVAIAAAARDKRIRALVSIASFADLDRIVSRRAWWVPGFWVQRALRKAERIADFSVRETSPVRNLARVACPTLIVHGDADRYVPFADAEELYDVAHCPKELFVIPGADHGSMFARGGDALIDTIASFVSSRKDN